jgi:hypothetical protein
MELSKVAVVDGKEYDLPDGITPIGEDGLFLVDFDLLELAASPDLLEVGKSKDIRFFNPRHLGMIEEEGVLFEALQQKGQGFNKQELHNLRDDIQQNGLEYHLCGFWTRKDDKIKAKLNDGERRFLCLQVMRKTDVKVWSPKDQQFMSAKEVYARIPVKIKPMSEEEALMRACVVSETAVKWGDAALARLVKVLYATGKSDETICKLLGKGKQWVAETYTLNDLDELCFSYLLNNKINRTVAKSLLKISNEKVRQQKCIEIFNDAVTAHAAVVAEAEKHVEKAENKEELARAKLEEAKLNGADAETIAALEKKVVEACTNVNARKQNRATSGNPKAKKKSFHKVTGSVKAMTASKVSKQLTVINDMIDKNDETYASVTTLKVVQIVLKALLGGDDLKEVLKSI